MGPMEQSSASKTPGTGFDDRTYVPPQIQSYSPEEFLDLIGPAQGYGGGGGSVPPRDRVGGNAARSPRLFPGLR